MWRNRFRGGFGPVVRQNTEWMNIYIVKHKTCCGRKDYHKVSVRQLFLENYLCVNVIHVLRTVSHFSVCKNFIFAKIVLSP